MTVNSEYAAYPENDTYGMQQAWRLFFDEKNLKEDESYGIEKNFPQECRIMHERSLRADGINVTLPRRNLTPQQNSYIEQKFINLLDLAFENPKFSFTASCVYIGGMTAAVVFFCRYISHQGF